MDRRTKRALAVLCVLLWSAAVAGTAGAAPPIVAPKLIANVKSISPGQKFRIGVLLSIAPEWHIYWKNPGDSGLPTAVNIALPAAYSAGPLVWPVPVRFEQRPGVVGYGYADEVLLTQEVTAPPAIEYGSQALFGAKVSWVGCHNICVPGSRKLELALSHQASSLPDNTDLFDKWERAVPVEWTDKNRPFSWFLGPGAQPDAYELILEWPKNVPLAGVFLHAAQPDNVKNFSYSHRGSVSAIKFSIDRGLGERASKEAKLEAVVAVDEGQSSALWVDVPLR